MKTTQLLTFVTVAALFAGCATAPPKELVSARAAYRTASEGPAAKLVPAELHKAHQALVRAEHSFKKDPKSYQTRDLSYVALRKVELASALGTMASDKASTVESNADFQEKQTQIVEQGKQDLKDAEQQAADEAVAAASDKADAELEASEARTADALAQLAKLAAVKEEDRGLVVTLSGSVLFRSSEAVLLPSAQAKLDQVGTALMAVKERNLIVEGHTDSQGSGDYNQDLSQRRAEAVRNYLVQKGYPSDRIRAMGRGKDSPIAVGCNAKQGPMAGDRNEGAAVAIQFDKAKQETQEAAQAVEQFAYAQKADFVAQMKAELANLQADLDKLSAKVEKSGAVAKADAQAKIEELRGNLAKANAQLDQAEGASESTWGELKTGFNKARVDLKESFEKSRQWLSDKIEP